MNMASFVSNTFAFSKGYAALEHDENEKYQDISPEDIGLESGPPKTRLARLGSIAKTVFRSPAGRIVTLLALLTLSAPLIFKFVAARSQRPLNKCYCGTTIAEAESLGCKFDPMSPAWLPAECRDAELSDAFEQAATNLQAGGVWRYFSDVNMTQPISKEEVGAMADTGDFFFADQHWHSMHCMFMWQKRELALLGKVVLEERYDVPLHAEHCTRVLTSKSKGAFSRVLLGGSMDILDKVLARLMAESEDEDEDEDGDVNAW
ncbi:hypothetical protein CKM354_000452600 [Cercospora kikuchii]|uniref:Uncharacterized protein n=1 Tax=Cercospora kikuchii TaxID=84275 RepID=A0A9P3CEB4_9PEZI|nr:uncharacterized protein CKM354_000452600 [Cercospora kikuchii]GIZ41213.1 hypothetical protein CKM354_000452600 [Cercospora kikuchii]